jgi:hypothetical protein
MVLIGRLLQYTGLIALPVAILLELSNLLDRSFGLSEMLVMLVFGFCAFHVGRYLEGFALGQDG